MKRTFSSIIAATLLAAAALGATSAAQARPDIQVSIGWPGQPVFVQPRPVYVSPPAVVYERPWQPAYRADFERERAWRHAEWQRREWERRQAERREWEHRHHDRSPWQGRDRD